MDHPFNFENQSGEGDKPERNQFETEAEARQAAKKVGIDIKSVLEAAGSQLDDPEMFPGTDITTHYREELYQLMKTEWEKRQRKGEELSPKERTAVVDTMKSMLSAGEGGIFYGETEFDEPYDPEEGAKEIEKPYQSLTDLYEDIIRAFSKTLWAKISVVNLVPRAIFLTSDGEIQSAEFSLKCQRSDMSLKFNEIFPNSDYFTIEYWRRNRERPHDNFQVTGEIAPNTEEDTVLLSPPKPLM